MTIKTTSGCNWPDIRKPHPCTCAPSDKGPVMVTIKARADKEHAWQLFTGHGSDIDYAEDDAMNHAAEWFGDDVLFEDAVAVPASEPKSLADALKESLERSPFGQVTT